MVWKCHNGKEITLNLSTTTSQRRNNVLVLLLPRIIPSYLTGSINLKSFEYLRFIGISPYNVSHMYTLLLLLLYSDWHYNLVNENYSPNELLYIHKMYNMNERRNKAYEFLFSEVMN